MFKIGDKIKCIKDTSWCDVKKGDIYTFDGYVPGDEQFLKLKEHAITRPHANDQCKNWELVQEKQMNKPHKHAELIKAWAMGAEIEVESNDTWIATTNPSWIVELTYRIKPEPKPDVIVIDHFKLGRNDKERFYALRDSYAGTKLQMTFDGETGKLKAVELLDTKN